MKKFIILLGLTLIITPFLFGQSPNSFNYQAVVRNSSNEIISDQAVGVQIIILIESASGSEVYSETHTVTTSTLGLINLKIGNGTTSDDFSNIDWGAGIYFVKIAIDVNGGADYVEMGTTQLHSVPYSLYAKTAEKISSSDSSKWIYNNDNIYYNKGFVGIGNTDPSSPLAIKYDDSNIAYATNTTLLSLDRTVGSSSSTFNIFGYPDNVNLPAYMNKSIMLYASGDADNLKLFSPKTIQFSIVDWISESGEIMRMTSDGYVGIGTTIPKAKLHIKSGDIYLEDIGAGIIMKSPDGKCWKITVDNNGDFQKTSITCPEN